MLVGAISEVFTIIIAVIIPFVLSSLSRLRSTINTNTVVPSTLHNKVSAVQDKKA